MCGICGSIALDGAAVDPGDVDAMLAAMVHRGPDAKGAFRAQGVIAGIRRLAVIDVEGGDQPIANEDGTIRVVFNGEIYNHRELRDELESRGHVFRTRSDTEVLVHLWEEHGADFVRRLNGMFAFCIHDARTGEIVLGRDRLGIKPLYWATAGGILAFASETAVLLRHGAVRGDLAPGALAEMFILQYPAGDATAYRGIRKLLPGHLLRIRNGEIEERRWWTLPENGPDQPGDDPAGHLRDLLESSVRYRRIADVPLGVFLSGGLDSTAVTAVLAGMSDRPVRSFSVGFSDARAFDEREHARVVSRRFETEHRELVLSARDIAGELPGLIEHLDEPVLDPAMIPTWLLSRFARREVTVVLTGEGADELFAGYRRYRFQRRFGALGKLPGIGAAASVGRRVSPRSRAEQAIDAIAERDPARSHVRWSAIVPRSVAAGLFGAETVEPRMEAVADRIRPWFENASTRLEGSLRADQAEWLPHNLLAKVDRASMACSLEARVPFLDHRIVEWAAGLPEEWKIRDGEGKRVVREAFRDRVPETIVARPKRGFDLPLADWIRGPLRGLAEDVFTPASLARWDGLRGDFARAMLDDHVAGRADHGLALFNLVSMLVFLGSRR